MSDFQQKLVRYIKRLGAGSMLISIIIHVVVILLATLGVVSSVQPKRKAMFKGGDDAGAQVQHPVKMSNTQPHLDTLTKRLSVDTPIAAVALPDLPTTPDSGPSSPALNTNGASGPKGGLKGPVMPFFGFREAGKTGSLVGYLYDLKQTRDRKPNPVFQKMLATMKGIAPYDELLVKEVGSFIQSNWSPGYLQGKFYRCPTPLYAAQVFVPDTPADEAPKAFEAEKPCSPNAGSFTTAAAYRRPPPAPIALLAAQTMSSPCASTDASLSTAASSMCPHLKPTVRKSPITSMTSSPEMPWASPILINEGAALSWDAAWTCGRASSTIWIPSSVSPRAASSLPIS